MPWERGHPVRISVNLVLPPFCGQFHVNEDFNGRDGHPFAGGGVVQGFFQTHIIARNPAPREMSPS
ncbi:MAG: hypothetical protein L0322_29270 [Chloroflexi bacterium]|nr:hypothetical protein [Chloroflexota bacterium]MCI0644394.1 hypothetical protein [Chloroflexota bacterium]